MSAVREHWSSKVGFVFAAIGSAVGLGLLWKFPYTIGQNGGGLFLLAYFVCLFVVGIPILVGELILGRHTQRASVGAFDVLSPENKSWKAIGWFGAIASFLIQSFYSVIAGWGLSYVLMSLNGFYKGLSKEEVSLVFDQLQGSGYISLLWHFVFTGIVVLIVLAGVRKGIEYWAKFMTKALLIVLVGLFIYGLTLKGFNEAAHFIFYPDPSKFKLSSAIEALGLAFWTLSIGQGIMIIYGSYMKKGDSIPRLAGVIAFSVIVVAILIALTIFPIVFTFGFKPQEGTGLIFKTLPFLFAQLPGALVFSTLFFILFVFTSLTSAIPLVEAVSANIMELYKVTRRKAVLGVGLALLIVGIPSAFAATNLLFPQWKEIYGSNFLDTVNNIVSIWIIPIGGFFTSIFIGWVMDKRVCKDEFLSAGGSKVFYMVWRFFIRWLVPLMIFVIIVQKSGVFDFDMIFKTAGGS
ncbi:MAG: hypothetical protein S4CHLAM37_14210 [Chlamydiia bacterium]|nr:hypothetical protein [Chlamydiia bacterium]